MKITDQTGTQNIIPQKKMQARKAGAGEFERMLDEKAGNVKTPLTAETKAQAVKSSAPLFIDQPISREEVVSRVMHFLDVMEEYSIKLGSPSATLKEINPLIARIETEKNDLQRLAESLEPRDELRGILDEALVRSSVEVIKFNRGDYLS